MNYLKICIKLIWKVVSFLSIYFVVINCFSYTDRYNNIIFKCPDELQLFYHKTTLDLKTTQINNNKKYAVILGELSEKIDETYLNEIEKYKKTKYINTAIDKNILNKLEFFAPFSFKYNFNNKTNQTELFALAIKSKPILLDDNRDLDLGCVVFGDPSLNKKLSKKNSTKSAIIYIPGGITVQESISCNNKASIKQCIRNFSNINYELNKNFKAYAGLMFYQAVYADITIETKGKVIGNYGIANSHSLVFEENIIDLSNNELSGTLYNKGEIIASNAAIDISCSLLNKQNNSKFIINNQGLIKGSIILSAHQHGEIRNSGKIEKNANNQMIINPGAISQIYNYDGGIITADALYMSDRDKYNKNFRLVNGDNSQLYIDNLQITNLVNKPGAKIKTRKLTVLMRECINQGTMYAKEISAQKFNNYLDVYSDNINGNFTNNKTARLYNDTTYESLVINADFTNYGIIETQHNLNIDKHLLNYASATCTANVMRISGVLNNFGYIEINESIRISEGLLFNKKGSTLQLNAAINHLNGKHFNFSNKGILNISNDLIVTTDFINEAEFIVNKLSCKENRASRARLINKSSATCKIEVLENAKIKNKGKLYIKNAKGTSYLDNYISYATLTIDKNANLIVDNLTLLDNYLTNNGKLVVVKEATIDGKIIDNKGILDLKCKTKLDNTIINSGTMLIGEINGLSNFELVNNQQSKVIFNKKIDNKHIVIDNKSIVAFNMPAVIKSYIGNNNSLLKLTLSEDHNQKILVKGNEISFAQSANILLTTPQEYSIKPAYVVKLISASKISIADINSMRENIHFYITKNETEDPNNLHQPILILNNLEIQQQSKQILQLDLQWVSIRPTLVNNINKSYYSNKEVADIFHGVIGTNNIKLTEYNNGSSWYASGASLCIGKTSANSAINNINASSSNQALTIEVLKNYVAIGNINIVNKINADNANAVSLENFNPSQSASALYLIKGMFIAQDAALISTKSSGLYIDQAIEGTITNYGIIQGKNSAININTINGAIVNDGTISAEYAIIANTKLTATSDSKLKSYKIINNNKIIGGLNLAGVGSHLINNRQIDASNKSIRVNAGNIDNLGTIVAGTIEVKKLYNTKSGKLNVNNLIIGKQLANYGAATVTNFNVTNDFWFLNEGSLIVTDTLKINKNFINNGDLLAQKILVDQPLILTATATLKADTVNSSSQDIKIYGGGSLILGNGVLNVTIDRNLILAKDTQLLLNATVTQSSSKVIATSISINQANKSFDYTIRPGALLNCRDQLEHTKLGIINSGTLNIAVGSCVRSYNGELNSALELKISDKAKLDNLSQLPASQAYMFSVYATAEFSNNSKIIIKFEDMFADIKQAEHKNIKILSCNNLIYNNVAVTSANVNNLIATEEYYGIDLNLTNININTSPQTTTISAILNINDNKPLADNMRRANLVLSKDLSANIMPASLSAIAWCNNMASSTSAYTSNLVIYPRYLARNTARINYNSANGLKINFDRITTLYSQPSMPAVIIGTEVKTDNYFSGYSTNTLDIKQIDINNLVVDGGHDNNKTIINNHGLVITGTNDLIVENNIHFGKNTKLLAGKGTNALYLDCSIKADIINDGIIGDKNTGCALYLGYPLLGKITNNNSLIAKKTAIKIDPLTHWQNNKQLTIDNYGTIDGDIDFKNSKNIEYKVSLINYGIIKNAVINCSAAVELSIDNKTTGNIDISNGLVADQIKANHGTIKAKSLVITKDLTIAGTFVISTLEGQYKKLIADYLIVDELKDINLTVNNLQLRSKLTGTVVLNNALVITKNIDQQANLTVPELHIKNQSKLTNNKNINILSGVINLNENNFENNGSLEIKGELKLSSDFTTHGNLIADTLYLNNHQLRVDANKVITVNNIYNKSNKILLLAPDSKLKLGNNVATATMKGNFYVHEKKVSISKIDKYQSNIELNAATVNLQGILKAGYIHSLRQVTFNVNKNSELLLSNIIKDDKLTLVNSSKVELRSGSILKNYIGNSGTKLILALDINNLSDNPILQVIDKAIFDIDSIIKLKPSKPLAKYKKINQYNKITLISATNNELKYYFNNKEIILNKKTALRLISHKLMNSYLIKMRNIQIESKDKTTELTVDIAIKDVKDISELSYLEQMLAKELMGDCANDKYIEGYAWRNKVVQNYLLSNNLIISPYKLAIDKNLINYKDDNLTIGNASKAFSIDAKNDMPSLVIGTKITDIYADENIRNISYDIDHLGLKSIKLTNITISGRDTLNKIDQDAMVITGNYPLTFDNSDGISIAKNCKIIGGKNHHGLHLATVIKGNLVNSGIIGDNSTSVGLFISQNFEGTITNNNIVTGSEFAINASMTIANDRVLNLVNNGIISGSLAFANTSKEADIGLVKLYNNGEIEGKNNSILKTNVNLDIYNAKLANITADNIKVNNIYNYGTITVYDKLKYDSFTNKGRLIFLGAKTLTLANSFNNNSGTIYATKIKCIDDEFINNGNIYTHQLGANILVNQDHGLIVVDNIYSKNIRIVNNGILQVRYLNLTKNIINHATLVVKNTLTLMNNIANSNFLNANKIDGNSHILTNKKGILSCNILNNIRVVDGVVIVKQAIIGTNNIDNLKINYQVNQNGTLKVNNNIEGLGEMIINGMANLKKVSVRALTNNSKTLTIGIYHNKLKDSSIDNKGKINAATINGCDKIVNHSGATIITNKLQNVICENEGRLVVKEKVKDIKVKGAIILGKHIKQIGFLDVEDLKADNITITGKVTVKNNANVSKLINTNIMRVDKKLIITSDKESINKRKLIVGELIISRGKLTNTNTGDLEVIGTNPVSLSDINFLNTGTAKISEVALKGDFTNYGNLTVYTVKNNNNVFKNKGNLYVKRGIILNDKFVNAGLVDISIANVSDSFTNSGTMIVQTLKGKISQVSTFINKAIADVYELQNIKIKNLANFKLADTISGKVEFTGILKLTGDIKQEVRSFCILDKIELASQEINYTISEKAYASFREAVKNDNLKIINYGVLSVDSGSKFKSYTSNGGVLNIWLTDTDITNAPLVRLQRAEFNTSKAPSSIVLRVAVVSENMLFSSTRVVKILQAENILYNGNIIANRDLFDLLAIQKVATNKFKQSIKAESILLKIDSPLIVKEYNAMYITANLSWYNVEDISILEDKPYSLNLIKSLHKDGLGAKTSSLQTQIKKNIYNNKLPEEALHVSEHILNIISSPGATKNQVKLKALAKNNFINLLSQIFPDNSLGAALTCASFSRTAFVDISKRLALDRVIGYQDKFSSKNRKKTRKNYWGINTGSSYLDLCLWSSGSITKYTETKNAQYAHNVWNSQTFSFGIDDKLLHTTKVGLMLSYIHSSLINKSIINTDNHNAALNTFLQSIYMDYQFPRVLLNFALLNANTSHEQHNTSTLATRYVSKYKTHILGFMSELVYPYSLKNMKLEFVEMVKFNSIFIPKYSSSDFETKSSQRVNIFSVGFATNFYYNFNINETSNINFLCSLLGYYSFNNTKNNYIKINYFNKDFSIKQRSISSYDISVDIATNINLNKVININLDIMAGIQKNSRFIGAKFYINYVF